MKKLLIFSLGLMAILFAACTSDTEDGMRSSNMYEYSAEEIQQIQKMQEEYGVTFNFNTKSEKPLPSMKDFEELCKFAAHLSHAKSSITRNGNSIIGTTYSKPKTRSYSNSKETVKEIYYSGEHRTYGSIDKDKNNYGSFEYEITWHNANSKHKGGIQGRVINIFPPSGWDVSSSSLTFDVNGDSRIDFTFSFTATERYGGGWVSDIKYKDCVTMSGQSTSFH